MRLLRRHGIATRTGWPPWTSSPARRPAASSWPSRPAASSGPGRSSPRRSATTTGSTRREFRRGFRIEPRRAGPARRRHPDDRRLAPRDDPGDRGGRRRDRRLPCPRRSVRRADHVDLAGRAAGSIRSSALWILDLPTYEPGPATCPPCAAGEPLQAPGSTGTGARRRDPPPRRAIDRGAHSWPPSSSPAARPPTGRRRRRSRRRRASRAHRVPRPASTSPARRSSAWSPASTPRGSTRSRASPCGRPTARTSRS